MFYKIVEVSTDKASGHTYILVHFWLARADFAKRKPPFRKNDFLMQLRPTGERIITNVDGWYKRLSDGVFIDPNTLDSGTPQSEWERETVDRDLPAEIKANIETYWERAEAKSFSLNHIDSRIQRDESDPYKVLERDDVKALRNAKVDKP